MTRHVDFLAQLYRVWGAVFGIVGVAGIALAAGAGAIARMSGPVANRSTVAAGLTAVTMAVLAGIALLWAALHWWVGRGLERHGPRSRLLALGLAVGNLPLIPFGTALGAYACWVLMHNDGRHVFVPTPPANPGPDQRPGSSG